MDESPKGSGHEDKEAEAGKGKRPSEHKDEQPKGPPVYKRPRVIVIASLVLLLVIVAGLLYWLHARRFASTDDAYIDGHAAQVAPQVPGQVAVLHVNDNQLVHKGDLLVELDATPYRVALDQARAQLDAAAGRLAEAEAQIKAAEAAVAEADAEIDAARVALTNATRDLERYQSVDAKARSQQQLDNSIAAQRNAQARLQQAMAKKASVEANVNTAGASVKAAQGDVHMSEANVKRAEVNLGYCRIVAPNEGRVTQRTVEPGNYLQPGQTMFILVNPDVWVIANFKETQLTYMQPGQPVTITIDAFPKETFRGHVDSIQAGSGSRFSTLPAENATGNFVKIVQRVPVKIIFEHDANTNDAMLLSPGMSVTPKVKIR